MKRILLTLTILASALSVNAAQTQLSALTYCKQDGTDQTANMQRAVNLAVSSGQTLYVPPGVVYTLASLTNTDNLMIEDYTTQGFKSFLGGIRVQPPTSAAISNDWGGANVTQLVGGFIKSQNQYNGPINVESFEVVGASDDTSKIQAAVDAATSGATVWIPPRASPVIFGQIIITQSNLTIDGGGNTITNLVLGTPQFTIMPRSLLLSGRLTGADYPLAWHTGGGDPTPVDGDFETMMYESNPALRITNIVIKNFRSQRDGNLLRAYSVDGLEIKDCTIYPPNNGAFRLFHCSNVRVHDNYLVGSTGSYTTFFFKCENARVYNNFIWSHGGRAISFKGARHPDNTSIFTAISPTNTYASPPIVSGNVIWFDSDGVAFDWPPDPSDDVGDAYSVSIGFSKGSWYGRFKSPELGNNTLVFKGTYADGLGRGLWTSFPHVAAYVHDNHMLDCGFFGAGLVGAVYKGNIMNWTRQSANAFFLQIDTATFTTNNGVAILGNIINNYYAAGTGGTDPEVMLLDGLGFTVRDNIINGLSDTLVNVVVTSDPTDQTIIERNRLIFDSTINANPNFIIGTFPNTNNVHGIQSDNVRMDSATGTTSTAGVSIIDNAAGSGIRIYSKGNFAGIGLMQRVGTGETYLGQIYEDVGATNLVLYHNTAPRITIMEDGSSKFFSYLNLSETSDPAPPDADKLNFYAKDNGSGDTRLYFQESDGTVTEVGTGAGGGGSVVDSTFGAAWNGVLTNAPSMNSVYDWGHTFDTDDDGKVNVLDVTAGVPYTSAGGVVSVATLTADRPVIATSANVPATSVVGASIALNVTPDLLPSSSYARPDSGENDYRVLFAQNEAAIWQMRLPRNYNGSMELDLMWSMASATAGSVVWSAEIWAVTPGDAVDINTQSFDTANTATTAVPGTAGFPSTCTITCSNADSAVSGDFVQIRIKRTDALAGDAELVGMTLNYGIK